VTTPTNTETPSAISPRVAAWIIRGSDGDYWSLPYRATDKASAQRDADDLTILNPHLTFALAPLLDVDIVAAKTDQTFPFGAQLSSYKRSRHNDSDCYSYRHSELNRDSINSLDQLIDRLVKLLTNDDYKSDEMELLVYLDTEQNTAKVIRSYDDFFQDCVEKARNRIDEMKHLENIKAVEQLAEKERRQKAANEARERTMYEILKAKFEPNTP
jgi:hypothetical protein